DRVALELAQAVLRRDRAAEPRHRVVDHGVYGGALRDQRRGTDVVVQVAVADVPEAVDFRATESAAQRGVAVRDELGDLRNRNRDVVLDVAELRLGNALAQPPERARL